MNAVVQFNPAQVPAFARAAELSEIAKALSGGGAGGKRISIKGGVFRLLDGGKEIAAIDERYLDVVLVKAAPKVGRVFYLKSYDAASPAGPDCWSPDGLTPSPEAENPQAKSCATCPKNVAGSGNGNSRACRYQQRVAVVLANDMEGAVMQLALPATSLFGQAQGDKRPLQEYARWLAAQRINPETVVTRLRFDTDSESPKLFFKAMRWLSEEEYATVQQQAASEDATKAVTMTVAKVDNVAPADPFDGPGTPPKGKAAAAVPPDADEDADEAPPPVAKRGRPRKAEAEVESEPPPPSPAKAKAVPLPDDDDEPTVRTPAPAKPAAPAKADLAKAISDWDDE
jgi:hypothetical protein